MLSAKWQPFCLCLHVLISHRISTKALHVYSPTSSYWNYNIWRGHTFRISICGHMKPNNWNSSPIKWKMCILFTSKDLRALRSGSSFVYLNRSPGHRKLSQRMMKSEIKSFAEAILLTIPKSLCTISVLHLCNLYTSTVFDAKLSHPKYVADNRIWHQPHMKPLNHKQKATHTQII